MNKSKAVKIVSSLVLLLLVAVWVWGKEFYGRNEVLARIFVCDVGQGDAIYIRFSFGVDMLVDGGPNSRVLECLAGAMPFYDRQIDVVMLTHPQADHLNGLVEVVKRYKVGMFATSPAGNKTEKFKELTAELGAKEIQVVNLYSGQSLTLGSGARMEMIWPERNWVADKLCPPSACPILSSKEVTVLGVTTDNNLNDFSLMGIISVGEFDMLFTGDGDERIQDEILAMGWGRGKTIEVMKIPHHGSKTGLDRDFLLRFKPSLGVISSGKNNRYGHPAAEIIEMLADWGVELRRTDNEGTVVVETDGKSWWVR